MDFIITIPSYNRLRQLDKLLSYLLLNNIDSNNIYVFADPSNYAEYLIGLDKYNINILQGVNGLINQRNHMRNYFNDNTNILYLDDDFISVKSPDEKFDFINEVNNMFTNMINNNCYLGSINPTNNLYFCSGKDKYGLYLCVGCFYLERNLKLKEFEKLIVDEKEDYTRTLIHYIFAGKVYRNDRFCVNHKYNFSSGGMNSGNREIMNNIRCNILHYLYPKLTSIFNKKTKKEIKFKQRKFKICTLDKKNENIEIGKYIGDIGRYKVVGSDNIKLMNNNGELLGILIKGVINIDNYSFLEKYIKGNKSTQRGPLSGPINYDRLPEYIKKHTNKKLEGLILSSNDTKCRVGKKGFDICNNVTSINYGYNFNKGNIVMSKRNKEYTDYLKQYLYFTSRLINNYFIEYARYKKDNYGIFDTVFNGLTINKSVECATHKDTNNFGFGALINSNEGNLCLPEYNLLVKIGKNDLFIFDSKNLIHSTFNNNKERYALIFFQNRFIK